MQQDMYIAGAWVSGASSMNVINKYSGTQLGSIAVASVEQVDAAVRAADAAAPVMASMPIHKRAEILRRVASCLMARKEEIAAIIAQEAGKAIKFARLEVERACDTFNLAAEGARNMHGETVPMDAVASGEGFFGFWQRKPVGVVAAITPFNFPLNLVAHKVAPALAAGNSIILKPAEVTPLTAGVLTEILIEAGVPGGAFNLVHGTGETVGDALIKHPLVSKISFTGSPRVGQYILANAGIKKVTLELGNSSPVIITASADIAAAAKKCALGANYNSGQVCISTQRIYVAADIYDTFMSALTEETRALAVGDPMDAATDVGPMISLSAAERIEAWVQEAVDAGAQVRVGAKREAGLYYPTVMEAVPADCKLMTQEVFAPVVSVVPYDDFEAALKMADDTQYGLQAAVFTDKIDAVFQAIKHLHFGGVVINDMPHTRPDHIPYGGNRQSGLGREGIRYAMEEMTHMQMVMIRTPHAH